MAWVDIGTRAELVDGSTVRGWAHFEYDNASGTTTRPCRIRIEARSGYSFNVMFRNITVAGTNYGTIGSVTQNSGVIWSANITAGGNVTATWENPWYAGTKYPSITGNLPSGASAPSGATVTVTGSTHNSVSGQFNVGNWGGTGSGYIAAQLYGPSGTARLEEQRNNVSSLTATITNGSTPLDGGITIKGCGTYRAATYASNSAGYTESSKTTVYTPPAPVSLTYTDPGGSGTKVYPIELTGTAADNVNDYTVSELKRSLRYKIGSGVWVTVVNQAQALIDDVTTFNLSLPAGATATVEGWMTYRGLSSEVKSVMISNDAPANVLYGSVNGQAKKIVKLYGSVNGQAKEIKKLYGSVNGVAKKIYEA